jgi:hypothetical protein
VDASGGLVCVVASLVDWICPVGVLYVLITFYMHGIMLDFSRIKTSTNKRKHELLA